MVGLVQKRFFLSGRSSIDLDFPALLIESLYLLE